jgi:hypothetical protein
MSTLAFTLENTNIVLPPPRIAAQATLAQALKQRRSSRAFALQALELLYLNAQDIRHRPSEIVAHECTHAAMAWVRVRGADLSPSGEELLCYAAGHLARQVNRCCLAAGVWR